MYEEDKIRKVSNRIIVKRLLGYLGRQKWLIIGAIILTVVLTGIQIFFPYLTKMAIDDYIISTVQVIHPSEKDIALIKSFKPEALIRLDEEHYAIKSNTVALLPSTFVRELYGEGRLQREKYYLFKAPYDDAIWKAVDHKEFENVRLLSHKGLSRLSKKEILTLRKSDVKGVKHIASIFLVLLVFHLGLTFVSIFALAYVGQAVMHRIRENVFIHLQRLKLSFFDRMPSGRLVTRSTNDVEKINEFFTDVLTGLFQDVFQCIGVVVVMLHLELRLSLVSFIVIPLIAVVVSIFRVKVRKVYQRARLLLARLNSKISESLNGIKVIQLFNQERRIKETFGSVNEDYYKTNMQQILTYGVFRPVVDILASVAMALVLWYGGGQVIQSAVTLGVLVAFLSYVNMFFRPIMDISERFNIAEEAMAASERVFTLLDTKEVEENRGKIRKQRLEGRIEFRNTWHRYEEEWVLKDVSFAVNPKERVAIVGPTGAGKTSIISLLPRFYEPERGQILVDGVPISEYDINFLRQNIGIVMQDVFIFSGSIKDNIRLNNQSISDEDISRMAEYVNAHKFIDKLPGRYDTDAKQRGARFSIGERQLLAFARALATNPTILILDEATSSVDSETESLIQDAIAKLLKERTSIVIAHRLSTIKTVDRILVIDKGKIVEEGTHSELIKKKGMYYALYRLQYMK
ncbi:hypothetical protein CH333_00940 [candidate division WOR-3 bacterium JGI_Cruoil_03_44_89]|uniref:ABC transporter ATP-binding protein n=1 Tax=candidate division WOR-3 bacterium JGI_Cruoil_03_44_89 TaxID=1973748 RepID=A0A235C0X0_UNCW3|nr:MAG: hypothetical protein CH333_00940 [candidate division WOR-3 bacterium JGI_Cruoil_03_44_89]